MRNGWWGLLIWLCWALPAMAQAERPIRIGIVEAAPAATLSANVDAVLLDGETTLARISARTPVAFAWNNGALEVALADGNRLAFKTPLRLRAATPAPENRLMVGTKPYRGDLEVRPGSGSLTVVNELPLEEYLYGVVPGEVIPSWHPEALKAQAVAARTYAISRLGQFASLGYDLKATVVSQVYGGVNLEKPSTNRAVDDTRGQILTYQGAPIDALYSDCSGGYTEAAGDVWGRPVPYLQSVPDFDQGSPRYTWTFTAAGGALPQAIAKLGASIGDLQDIIALERTFSGRVKRARLVGSQGQVEVTGEKLRFAFGLRSTFFNVARQPDGSFLF
ncbi:MAG TPA: SpoIID/LytB domain-containing protein, partial [Stenomitos sp.]